MFLRPGMVVWVAGIILTSLSTIVVALRYYCRYFLMGTVGATDHLMLTALLITWGNTVINYYQDQTSSSFRPSQFRIPEKRPKIAAALQGTLLTWYMYRITYIIGLCFVKLSILFFYRAIASHITFRRMVYATITFISLYTFAATIANIFQCQNPSDSWSTSAYFSQFDGPGPSKTPKPKVRCNNPVQLWVFSAAVNLFTDVVILLLPIPTLLGLRVPMNKRLALVGIFSVGIMAIVASCVRMWVMALWSESPANSAHFGADLLLWGQVETNSGIISASVPFLRMIFRGREKEPSEKNRGISPPRRPVDTNNKPLEISSMAFFSGPDVGPNGSPIWKPFITVPASLSSSSRDSAALEAQHPHQTV
ncbi:uncharacterized protein BDR25DRAFT_278305 [Lindgomyces ingoldianus]|uniref:Uncharacterized protein n=1 Tax=Lindgomyces ingoldianus TaxID=673940 RepID=A0ACB6R8Q1_9PLEO|nr:uncharacterized protein BDR25DRAFT_278305 [Lindgomyces ingoldianus]KAF2475699.1 hypothetical protein BDR25DRAFT_278305 [Lindgomyces ingoldianus]